MGSVTLTPSNHLSLPIIPKNMKIEYPGQALRGCVTLGAFRFARSVNMPNRFWGAVFISLFMVVWVLATAEYTF